MAKAKKYIRKKFDNLVWKCTVVVQAGGTIEEFVSYIKRDLRKHEVDDDDTLERSKEDIIAAARKAGGLCFKITERDVAIWFVDKKPTASIVAHEALHASFRMLEPLNINPDSMSGEEAYAYTIGWLVREISWVVW